MPTFEEKLLAAAIFLALEVPLGVIAYRVTRQLKPFLAPAALLVAAVVVPDAAWGGLFLIVGLFTMFGQAIGARVRKTTAEERRQLAAHGPSPWLGQSRRSSLTLIAVGTVAMLVGIASDTSGRTSSVMAIFIFYAGSIMLGIGLFRRHTVLVLYLGRRRAVEGRHQFEASGRLWSVIEKVFYSDPEHLRFWTMTIRMSAKPMREPSTWTEPHHLAKTSL